MHRNFTILNDERLRGQIEEAESQNRAALSEQGNALKGVKDGIKENNELIKSQGALIRKLGL